MYRNHPHSQGATDDRQSKHKHMSAHESRGFTTTILQPLLLLLLLLLIHKHNNAHASQGFGPHVKQCACVCLHARIFSVRVRVRVLARKYACTCAYRSVLSFFLWLSLIDACLSRSCRHGCTCHSQITNSTTDGAIGSHANSCVIARVRASRILLLVLY